MTEEIKIPEGYVMIPKGGRPKKTARDIALFIAFLLKKEELGKVYLAHDWIMQNFKHVNDSGHVRACLKKAKKALPKSFFLAHIEGVTFLVPPPIANGSILWGWAPGDENATEMVIRNFVATAELLEAPEAHPVP